MWWHCFCAVTQIRAEEGKETSQRGEVAETFPNPGERGRGEGREGQSHRGWGRVLFGWRRAAKQNHRGVEHEEGGENGCFQFTGKETRPFYQPNNEAWWLSLPNPPPPKPSINNSRPHDPQHLNFSPSCLLPFTSTITAAYRDINQERWQLLSNY